jgi:hypothetical protein
MQELYDEKERLESTLRKLAMDVLVSCKQAFGFEEEVVVGH